MPADYDASEFIDRDFLSHRSPSAAPSNPGPGQRAPTREEVDSRVAETQQRLAELKRAQEDLERERTALEETRRRQAEFQTGRQEMVQNLTRGVGLLEEAEFAARRDAELMAKTLVGFRDALTKVEAIHEETWTGENLNVELTRALTHLENARMEWNSARLKLPILTGQSVSTEPAKAPAPSSLPLPLGPHSFGELCRVGFALTWPLAAVALLGIGLLLAVLLRH
ncbi:MAG: hypothetical protein ACREIC_02490 [Limisphaerales bacterium]